MTRSKKYCLQKSVAQATQAKGSRYTKSLGKLILLTLLITVAQIQIASADGVAVSFSGKLGSIEQPDTYGLFGHAGKNLAGKPFSAEFTYDPSDFTLNAPCGIGQYNSNISGALTISILIDGHTYTQTAAAIPTACTESSFEAAGISLEYEGQPGIILSLENQNTGEGPAMQMIANLFSTVPTLNNIVVPPGSIIFDNFAPAGQPCCESLYLIVGEFKVISPFLLEANNLGNLDLASLIPKLKTTASATGIAADGVSTAIVMIPAEPGKNVTFTTSNGTSLAQFSPSFLTQSPQQGSQQLVVMPIQIGTTFYAVALLQAPQPGISFSYADPIVVTAEKEDGKVEQAAIPLLPPPVYMVHGLWGDETSLSSYAADFAQTFPWKQNPGLIFSSSYSGNIAFSSGVSMTQVRNEIATELQQLQSLGIVVGRTDVVAHSMGGLLIRSYSGKPWYLSATSREQGQFHTIVTLDTPEAGSNLATYLVSHQGDVLSNNASLTDEGLWWSFCGFVASTTVGDCLDSNGKPVNSGAVASLRPFEITHVSPPLPNIPHATWLAISGTNDFGVEHTSLQEFIDASNPKTDEIKLKNIVGQPNDDIVALSSQLAGNPFQYVTLPNTPHAAIFGTKSVTNELRAIQQAECWIRNPLSSLCLPSGEVIAADSHVEPFRYVPGHMTLEQPSSTVVVGRSIGLAIRADGVKSFEIEQAKPHGGDVKETIALPSPLWDGSTLKVTPEVIGKTNMTILAEFLDGSFTFAHTNFVAAVDPSSILTVRADPQFHRIVIQGEKSTYQLNPHAIIAGSTLPVPLGSLATYSLVTSDVPPAVSVDRNGVITSRNPGQAVVQVSFEGHKDEIAILVK